MIMINIFIIMLCWCVDMPLWLSIVGTVLANLSMFDSICVKTKEYVHIHIGDDDD